MGNNLGGGSSKTAKVMKISGEFFRLKTPAKVFDVIKDYPDHVLLDSEEFLRFNLRAMPLDPEDELKPKKIYLLVELPKFPIKNNGKSPITRVRSGVHSITSPRNIMMTRRSVSNLSIMTKSTAATGSTESDDGGSVDSPVGPTRVKMRLPKSQVERIMEESNNEVEIAKKILRLYLQKTAAENSSDEAAPMAEDGGGHSEGEAGVDRHCFSVHDMCSPCTGYHKKYKKLTL